MTKLNIKNEENSLDLRVLYQVFLAKKRFIIVVGLLILALSLTYTAFKKQTYQATVLLQIHPNHQKNFDSETDKGEPASVQIALIRSKFILEPVIKELHLDIYTKKNQHFFSKFFNKNTANIEISELEVPSTYLNKPLKLMIDKPDHFKVLNNKGDLLIHGKTNQLLSLDNSFSINVKTNDISGKYTLIKKPDSEMIKYLLSHLMITDLSSSSDSADSKDDIIQLSFTDTNPDKAKTIVNQIATITKEKDAKRKSMEAEGKLEFLNQQLPIVQASLKEAETKLNHYRATSGKIDIKLQTQYLLTHLADINKQLEALELKKMEMYQQYTSYHPFVIALAKQQNELEKRRLEIMKQIKTLPESDQTAVTLSRDVNIKNKLYMLLLNQIQEQQVISAGITSDIHILSFANSAELLSPLKPTIIGIASFIIGVILACLYILIQLIFIHPQAESAVLFEKIEDKKSFAI